VCFDVFLKRVNSKFRKRKKNFWNYRTWRIITGQPPFGFWTWIKIQNSRFAFGALGDSSFPQRLGTTRMQTGRTRSRIWHPGKWRIVVTMTPFFRGRWLVCRLAVKLQKIIWLIGLILKLRDVEIRSLILENSDNMVHVIYNCWYFNVDLKIIVFQKISKINHHRISTSLSFKMSPISQIIFWK